MQDEQDSSETGLYSQEHYILTKGTYNKINEKCQPVISALPRITIGPEVWLF